MHEKKLTPEYDFERKSLHSDSFRFLISAPIFSEGEKSNAIDFDSREWMADCDNEMKLISDGTKILNILTDSVVLETGLVESIEENMADHVFRYFARFANRLTVLSTAPMKFVRL